MLAAGLGTVLGWPNITSHTVRACDLALGWPDLSKKKVSCDAHLGQRPDVTHLEQFRGLKVYLNWSWSFRPGPYERVSLKFEDIKRLAPWRLHANSSSNIEYKDRAIQQRFRGPEFEAMAKFSKLEVPVLRMNLEVTFDSLWQLICSQYTIFCRWEVPTPPGRLSHAIYDQNASSNSACEVL